MIEKVVGQLHVKTRQSTRVRVVHERQRESVGNFYVCIFIKFAGIEFEKIMFNPIRLTKERQNCLTTSQLCRILSPNGAEPELLLLGWKTSLLLCNAKGLISLVFLTAIVEFQSKSILENFHQNFGIRTLMF